MMDVADLFVQLESNQPHIVEDVKKLFHELFNSCNPNDTGLVTGLFDYSMQTGSLRTVEILVGIKETHVTHLFNKFCESLRGNHKLQGLTLLGHVVRRQPTWMFKITRHLLFKDLLKLLKTETEFIPLMSALLVVNILLPMVAGLMQDFLSDLFHAFSYLALWPSKLSEAHLLHLRMALYALFLRLYGMYPCNFLSHLRQEYSQPNKIAIFTHTIKPMLDNVKMHPLLVTARKEYEVSSERWRKMEPHDVLVECARFAIGGDVDKVKDEGSLRTNHEFAQSFEEKYLNRSGSVCASERDQDMDMWSPTAYCGMTTPPESAPTSIPHTPIAQTHIVSTSFPQQEGTSPPEAAVEATPETTPIKDLRQVMRVPPASSNVPRALNALHSPSQSQPASPLRKESSPFRFPPTTSDPPLSAFHQPDPFLTQKVQRIVSDRNQSAAGEGGVGLKPRGLLQPTSPLRLIDAASASLSLSLSHADTVADQDDREVEIMMTSSSNSLVWSPRHCDSVVGPVEGEDELEECQQEQCTAGGICMPNSNSMRDFTQQVKSRLRFYSQCQADQPHHGLSTGNSPSDSVSIPLNSKVRRANSCPDMKKTSTSLERHPVTVEKVDEEPCSVAVNGHAVDSEEAGLTNGKETASSATQTDNLLPYEHLFLAVFPTVENSQASPFHPQYPDDSLAIDTGSSSPVPQKEKVYSSAPLDMYMGIIPNMLCDPKKNKLGAEVELRLCREQLTLLWLQLHFEKHRREMHAERNRRLLGKCRKVRSQEELTSALKDQLSLLQSDKELLHNELHKREEESHALAQQLQETINYYRSQNASLHAELTKEHCQRELTEQQLKQEREKTANVTKESNETKAALFTASNELIHATSVASEGRDLRETIQSLQRELVISGEVRERFRQRVNSLLRHVQQAAAVELVHESFTQQVTALKESLETQSGILEANKTRVSELDLQLARRDATIADSRKQLQQAKDEFYEQLEAVESKYNGLRSVNNRLEGELIKLKEEQGIPPLPSLPPPPSNNEPFISLQAAVELPVLCDNEHSG